MRKQLVGLLLVVGVVFGSLWLGNDIVVSQQYYLAILAGVIPVAVCVWIVLRSVTPDKMFLMRLFAAALGIRYFLAFVIYSRHLQQFLGADAETYDAFGNALMQSWRGLVDPNAFWLARYTNPNTSGFGMYYFVAGLYYVIGQNPLAIQLINCALGAGVCIAAYKIAMLVYPRSEERRVGK